MQERQHRPDYPTVDEPSVASALESAGNAGTAVSILKPYKPPNPPHGLPHVVQFATVSSMNLPIQVRFLIIILARYANVDGVASVAVTTLCELCEIGSKNTVERWLALAAQIGILRKEPGKGGQDRKSNTYTFLGKARNWVPLPVGHPETVPIIALAEARRVIEELQVKAARVEDLETEVDQLRAELTLLTNGRANGHPEVTNGRDEETPAPTSRSYESQTTGHGHENHEAIGHSKVTNGETSDPAPTPADSYESPGSSRLQDREGAIGHSEVTNGAAVPPAETGSNSYENTDPNHPQGDNAPIGHSEVTNGSTATEADSYETPTPQEDDRAIGHSSMTNGEPSPAVDTGSRNSEDTRPSSPLGENAPIDYSEVTNGLTEGEAYLARRARVEPLVTEFRDHYQTSFRGGVPSAVHYFSESDSKETELRAQVETLRNEAQAAAARPPPETEDPAPSGRRGVEYCPTATARSPRTTARTTAPTALTAEDEEEADGHARRGNRQDPQIHPREHALLLCPGREACPSTTLRTQMSGNWTCSVSRT